MNKTIVPLLICISFSYGFTLRDSFLKSLENDSEIQTRENELKKIKYDIDIANGLMYPTLDILATASNVRTSQNSYTPKNGENISTDEYSLNLKQPLYDGLQSKYERELQDNRYESAQYYLKEAKNNLALSVSENYINVLRTKDMISLSTESYKMSEDIYNKTVKKVERGFGTKLEYERAKGNLQESNVNLAIDRLNFADAMQNLYKNIQEKVDSSAMVNPTFNYNLPPSEEEALNFALTNHPSIQVSLENVKVATSEQQRDLKMFHPNVNLVGSYKLDDAAHKEDSIDPSNEYEIGLELSFNLYNGGKDYANNKKSLQVIREKRILVEKSNQEVSNQLMLAWNSYILNQEKLVYLQEFLKTRKLVLDATFEEFYLGSRDLGSVIDANLDYISTKRSTISTTYDLLLAHFRLLEALGVLSEVLEDKKENVWSENKIQGDVEKILDSSRELVYSYSTLQNEESSNKEKPKFEYLDEEKINN